jgi:hypothetical protein
MPYAKNILTGHQPFIKRRYAMISTSSPLFHRYTYFSKDPALSHPLHNIYRCESSVYRPGGEFESELLMS